MLQICKYWQYTNWNLVQRQFKHKTSFTDDFTFTILLSTFIISCVWLFFFLSNIQTADLSKAFDCVHHDLVLAKLAAYGLDESFVRQVCSYLLNRKQCVRINNINSDFLNTVSDFTLYHEWHLSSQETHGNSGRD